MQRKLSTFCSQLVSSLAQGRARSELCLLEVKSVVVLSAFPKATVKLSRRYTYFKKATVCGGYGLTTGIATHVLCESQVELL